MVCWAWKLNKLYSHTNFVFFWNHLGLQIIALLNGLYNKNRKVKRERTWTQRKRKRRGLGAKPTSVVPYLAPVATVRTTPSSPPRFSSTRSPLLRPRMDKGVPHDLLPSLLTFPLSRDLTRPRFDLDAGTLAPPPRSIAGVPPHHLQIAWSRSSASSSSTTSPSLASWSDRSSPPSSFYRSYIDRKPSSIPATSSFLRPLRPARRVRGEHPHQFDPLPLALVPYIVGMIEIS